MRVIDCNPPQERRAALDSLSSRLDSALKKTPFGHKDAKAHQAMISMMERGLNNRFYLLQNVSIEGLEKPISSILIGPPGVFLLNINLQKGIFRAKEDTWSEMKGRNRQFEPTQPNLIKESLQLSEKLSGFLSDRLAQAPAVQPVLILLNPGTHVDSVRPAVRTILMDGVERFIARLPQEPPQLTSEEAQLIINRLREPAQSASESAKAGEKAVKNWQELQALKPVLEIEPKVTQNIHSLSNKIRFSTRQWVLLGIIGILNISLLITFLILILLNT